MLEIFDYMRDRFNKLIEDLKAVLAGKATETEVKHLHNEMGASELQQILNNCRDEDYLFRKWETYRRYSPEDAYRQFAGRVKPHAFRIKMIRICAAASVIFTLGIGIWWLAKPEAVKPVIVENKLIEPGTKKALLKLADGSTIDVTGDSMRIEKEEGVRIAYTDGGISYQTKKEIKELVYNELIVPVAGECFITLDDGTRVWVNSESKLKYPVKFVGENREVFLEGEAYFEVRKAGKPFIVNTSMGNVNVLGTVFDVKAYREEKAVYTTLISGKVSFQGQQAVVLEPGEQAVAFADGKVEKRVVDVTEFVGWKEGVYVFKKQTLESIMTDLARWYDINVFYQTPGLKEVAFTGNLKRYDNINTFMEILQRTGDVKYRISGNTIILYK